jgi:hypothetical protein
MAVRTRVLSISEFLWTYVLDEGDVSLAGVKLRAEIERHRERTVTIESRKGARTVARCQVCPREDGRPCMALRVLALPYARHPAYRQEWWVPQPGAELAPRELPSPRQDPQPEG